MNWPWSKETLEDAKPLGLNATPKDVKRRLQLIMDSIPNLAEEEGCEARLDLALRACEELQQSAALSPFCKDMLSKPNRKGDCVSNATMLRSAIQSCLREL